jgi:O-antigen/teichoic acid export membrane protein
MNISADIRPADAERPSDAAAASEQAIHSVRRGVAAGALFMVLLRFSFRLIGLVNTFILVRLLLPSDFGLVGLVTAAYSALDLLSQMSLQMVIIRMPSPTRDDYDTAWTLGLIRGVLIAGLLLAVAPFLASYIHEPRVVQLCYVLAAVSVAQGFENIRLVDLQRELRYQQVFTYQVVGKIAGVLTTIPLAFYLHNYWALISGIAAMRFTMIIMGYAMRPYRPRLCVASWHELFHFSKWLMVGNMLWVVDANVMTFLMGRIAGSAGIGMYQVGYQIGALPASEIAAPIRDPLYAGSARLLGDMNQLRRYFFENLELMIAVITPLSVGICLMARPIALIFLGAKWAATIPLIQYCAFYALFDAIGHYPAGAYIVLNKQHEYYGLLAVLLLVRVPAIVIGGLFFGTLGALIAVTATAVLAMVMWNAFLPRVLGARPRDFFDASWRTALASLVMAAALVLVIANYPEPKGFAPQLFRFSVICLWGAIFHIGTQLALWAFSGFPDGAERQAVRGLAMLKTRIVCLAA